MSARLADLTLSQFEYIGSDFIEKEMNEDVRRFECAST
jgi:hypothetical protein